MNEPFFHQGGGLIPRIAGVAVSDAARLEKIRKHAKEVPSLGEGVNGSGLKT